MRIPGLPDSGCSTAPRAAVLLCIAAVASASAPVAAQSGGGGLHVQSYRFNDPQAAGLADFRLMSAPFAVALPVGRMIGLEIMGAWAEGRATGPEGAEAVLSGTTDTRAALSVTLVPEHVVVRAESEFPTGRSMHSLEEAAVAGVVAAEFLPFAISSWGSGGSVGGDVALAFQAGGVGIGMSGGYQAAREYEPLTDQPFVYRPGDQLRVRLALDGDVGESGTLSVLLGVQRFSEDLLGGTNLFQSGNRVEGLVSYAFAVGLRGSAQLYGGVLHRARGAVLGDLPALEGATDSPSQQLLSAGLGLRLPVGGRTVFRPTGDVRGIRTADGIGQGWMGSAGAAFDLRVAGRRFGPRLVLAPSARVHFGRIVAREEAESSLTGWEAGFTVRVEGGR